MVNAHHEPLDFTVQVPGEWHRIVDTLHSAPEHVLDVDHAPVVGATVTVADRSVVVLST
jgi:hypothetical protein